MRSRPPAPRARVTPAIVALLLAGCAPSAPRDGMPMAAHGLGRAVYKQLVAISRAASRGAPIAAWVQNDAAAWSVVNDPALAPAPRSDVPPGSWVAAFPAPDLEPMPTPPEPLPTPAAYEPPPRYVAEPPPAPRPPPPVDPGPIDEPAPAASPGPDVVVYAPAAQDTDVQPSPPPPNVTVIIVPPVIAPPIVGGYAYASPFPPPPPSRFGARGAVHAGGFRVGQPASSRR